MKLISSIFMAVLFSQTVMAEIWEKPPYRPDENHLPRIIYHKQAQEEFPPPSSYETKNKKSSKKLKKEKKSSQ